MTQQSANVTFLQRHGNALVMALVVIGLMVQPLVFPPPSQPCTMCTIEKMSRMQHTGDQPGAGEVLSQDLFLQFDQ